MKGKEPDISSSLNLLYDQFEKFYGDVIYLPLDPGIEYDDYHPTILHRSPDMYFSGANVWNYIDGVAIQVQNNSNNHIEVPNLYDDADFKSGKGYVADCLITGETIPRTYTFNNALKIKLGEKIIAWDKDQENSTYSVTYSADSDPLTEMKQNNTNIFKGAKLSYRIGDADVDGWNTILDYVYINNKGKSKDELSYDVTIETYIEPAIKLMYKNSKGDISEYLPYEHVYLSDPPTNVDAALFPVLIE